MHLENSSININREMVSPTEVSGLYGSESHKKFMKLVPTLGDG